MNFIRVRKLNLKMQWLWSCDVAFFGHAAFGLVLYPMDYDGISTVPQIEISHTSVYIFSFSLTLISPIQYAPFYTRYRPSEKSFYFSLSLSLRRCRSRKNKKTWPNIRNMAKEKKEENNKKKEKNIFPLLSLYSISSLVIFPVWSRDEKLISRPKTRQTWNLETQKKKVFN